MRREEIDILASYGIHPAMAMDQLLRMEYVGGTGEVEDALPWRQNLQLAMDAQPTLVTTPSAAIAAAGAATRRSSVSSAAASQSVRFSSHVTLSHGQMATQ